MARRLSRYGTLIALALLHSGYIARAQIYAGAPAQLVFRAPADTALTPDINQPQVLTIVSTVNGSPNLPFEWSLGSLDPVYAATPNFLTITPSRGVTPAKVSLALSPSVVPYLTPGTYNMGVSFRCTDPAHPGGSGFSVTLFLGGQITVTISGIVNSASQQAVFAPGEITSIYGSNLGTQPVSATYSYSTGFGNRTVYPTSLGNTTVTIAGIALPLLYVSPNQINAVIPYELTNTALPQPVIVTHDGISSEPFSMSFNQTAPGIFTVSANGQGQGAISNVDSQTGATTVNSVNNPAPKGSAIVLYATGGGQLTQSSGNGVILTEVLDPPYYAPTAAVSLAIGGQPAQILYAGAAPGAVSGLLQINAVVPSGIAPGAQPVVLTIGSSSSQQGVTVAVQ